MGLVVFEMTEYIEGTPYEQPWLKGHPYLWELIYIEIVSLGLTYQLTL